MGFSTQPPGEGGHTALPPFTPEDVHTRGLHPPVYSLGKFQDGVSAILSARSTLHNLLAFLPPWWFFVPRALQFLPAPTSRRHKHTPFAYTCACKQGVHPPIMFLFLLILTPSA